MYRIFINDNTLILSGSKEILNGYENAEIEQYSCSSCMNRAIAKVENGLSKLLVLQGSSVEVMWKDFCSRYKSIEAAGGIVTNTAKEVLWIRRNEKWDLPKGKVEIGEKVEDTAVREVEEECAVNSIVRGELLGITYHTYTFKGEHVLKKSYWYAMTCATEQNLIPQTEEGITEVVWANPEMHRTYCLDTYTSIAELLKLEKVVHYLGF